MGIRVWSREGRGEGLERWRGEEGGLHGIDGVDGWKGLFGQEGCRVFHGIINVSRHISSSEGVVVVVIICSGDGSILLYPILPYPIFSYTNFLDFYTEIQYSEYMEQTDRIR